VSTHILFEIFEAREVTIFISQIWANLNPIEINLIRFEKPNRVHCAVGPTCQRRVDRLTVLPHAEPSRRWSGPHRVLAHLSATPLHVAPTPPPGAVA
jgi:hypothetical protein